MDSDNKNPKSFTEEPIKKHRGRKPKIKEPVEIKEKKKRGRKPKVKEPEDTVKVFKKRGRKPIGKIIDFSKDNTSISIDDDYIARIPLHPNDFNKLLKIDNKKKEETTKMESIDLTGNIDSNNFSLEMLSGNTKDMYTTIEVKKMCDYYERQLTELKVENNELHQYVQKVKKDMSGDEKNVYHMNIDFVHIDDDKTIIEEKTDVHCWWCCHQFENPPCFVPDKYVNGTYHVFGCFCSFNCALAWNIENNDYKTWERTSLLLDLFKKINGSTNVLKTADPRQCLKMFGGNISIESFRKDFKYINYKSHVILPPMTSIVPLIERTTQTGMFDLTHNKIAQLADSNKLKLRRIKPLKKQQYSLEKTMGLVKKVNTI
jgi:hypothetical protein